MHVFFENDEIEELMFTLYADTQKFEPGIIKGLYLPAGKTKVQARASLPPALPNLLSTESSGRRQARAWLPASLK